MRRIRGAGLIKIGDGYAFIHRLNVKPSQNPNKPFGEYYVFPGGGLEGSESIEECIEREIKEELGINVEVQEKLYERITEDGNMKEYVYLCKYISGKFGTGIGPEFSNDSRYVDRGNYIPTIIKLEDIKYINLLPKEFKEKLILDIERGYIS